MQTRTPLLATGVAALALLAAACGGGGGDRPSAGELSKKFQDEAGFSAEAADCSAKVIVDSDISDAGLRKVLESDFSTEAEAFDESDISADDKKASDAIEDQLSECLFGDLEIPTTTGG